MGIIKMQCIHYLCILKVDLRTATFLELKEVFEKSNTSNCNQSTSGKIVSEYLASK